MKPNSNLGLIVTSHQDINEAYNRWAATYDGALNPTRDVAHDVVQHYLKEINGGEVLDLGCGSGLNLAKLASVAENVTGVDSSEKMLEQAKRKPLPQHVWLVHHNILESWPFLDNHFDVIVVSLVLEHIRDLSSLFKECCRTLKPSGWMLVCEYHPKRQAMGKSTSFYDPKEKTDITIPSFVHTLDEYKQTAKNAGFILSEVKDWPSHDQNNTLPQVLSFRLRNAS
jgi:ubiquinone/menaquinone biosynthesis C-methylase UbiE